jgi:hypothetical protein
MLIKTVTRTGLGGPPLGPVTLASGSDQFRGLQGTQLITGMASAMYMTVPNQALRRVTPEGGVFADTRGMVGDGTDNLLTRTTPIYTSVPLTISTWYTPFVSTGTHNAVTQGEVASTGALLTVGTVTGPLGQYAIRTIGGGAVSAISAGTSIKPGQLNLITGVSTSLSNHLLYANGVQVGSDATAVDATPAAWANIVVGALRRDVDANFCNGAVQQWAIWNRALTAAEVWNLYDPATRWDLYWTPGRKIHFDLAASATGNPWYAYRQQ